MPLAVRNGMFACVGRPSKAEHSRSDPVMLAQTVAVDTMCPDPSTPGEGPETSGLAATSESQRVRKEQLSQLLMHAHAVGNLLT